MSDSERIRDRSVRLFALALKAREDGKLLMAAELEQLAIEACDHAREVDQREVQTVTPAAAPHQQRAQPRPDGGEKQ